MRFLLLPKSKFYSSFSSVYIKRKYSNGSYIHRVGSEPLKYLNIGQIMRSAANKYPEREFIVSCDEKIRTTFGEAILKSDKFAAALLNLGLEKDDHIAIWSPNYEFWIISMIAIARAGMSCVTLNPVYQLPELKYCIDKVKIKAVIAPESFRKQKYYDMLMNFNGDKSLKKIIIKSDKKLMGALNFDEILNASSDSDVVEIEKLQPTIAPDSCANIQFTSGTTGRAKASRVSHFSMVNNGYDMGKRLEFDKISARICVNNPLFHAYGTAISIMVAVNHGSCLVLPSPHFSPQRSLEMIASEKCNVIYGTPTMYVDLISKQKEMKMEMPQIEISNTAGAICSPQLSKDIQKYLNVKKVRSMYGLTEVTSACFQNLPTDDNDTLEHNVGAVCDHVEAKVIDENGMTVPFGQRGELCIRSYLNIIDFYDDDEKTREVLGQDGWLKTGDQFILYENGYGQIVGRIKEMIIRGGENIFPKEIEDFLNTHPDVKETHVIGISDSRMGEEVAAFLRLKDGIESLSHENIKEFCKGRISHFKVPRYVIIVDEFPRTTSGKVQKFKFTEVFDGKIQDAINKENVNDNKNRIKNEEVQQ